MRLSVIASASISFSVFSTGFNTTFSSASASAGMGMTAASRMGSIFISSEVGGGESFSFLRRVDGEDVGVREEGLEILEELWKESVFCADLAAGPEDWRRRAGGMVVVL